MVMMMITIMNNNSGDDDGVCDGDSDAFGCTCSACASARSWRCKGGVRAGTHEDARAHTPVWALVACSSRPAAAGAAAA